MKNRTIIGIVCILLAVLCAFGAQPLVNKMTSGKTKIVRINKDMSQGKRITDEDISIVEVGKTGLQENVIRDQKAVVGKYAACDIKANTNILLSYLSDTSDGAEDIFKRLDGNKQAVSISIGSFSGGLSGKLENGDIVSIIVTKNKETTIPAELTYVQVITTTTASGTDKDELKQNDDGTYELPTTATLLVNKTQATLLAGYEAEGKMHLALVYRGTPELSNNFLAAQEKVFQESEVKDHE